MPGVEEARSQIQEARRFVVYPNPARSVVRVRVLLNRSLLNASGLTIKLFDVSGKLVKEIATATPRNDNIVRISLKGINPGIYFVQFGIETRKIVVNK
jgi:hypothetical protein